MHHDLNTLTTLMKEEKIIMSRVFDKNYKHVGYIMGRKDEDGKLRIGWSKCAKGDKFDRTLGMRIAYERVYVNTLKDVPHCVRSMYEQFQDRCKRYFKID